jgi:thiopeptide-type bacteriocin biosynthesis protein
MNLYASVESEWIAVYLFSEVSFESAIAELVSMLVDDPAIASKMRTFFFIRYWEGGRHIRLRILPRVRSYKEEIIKVIEDRSHFYFSAERKSKKYWIEFCEYKREADRYNGPAGMKISEFFFESSSRAVMQIIQKYSIQWSEQLALGVAIKMHAIFANIMLSVSSEKRDLFSSNLENWILHAIKPGSDGSIPFDAFVETKRLFQSSFELQSDRFKRIFDSALQNREPEDWEETWTQGCLSFREQLDASKPYNKKEMIQFYDAHLHMTNNRLGIHLRDEAFIAYVLKQLYGGVDVKVSHPTKISIA